MCVRIVIVPIDKLGFGASAYLYKNSGCAHRQTEGSVCICVRIVIVPIDKRGVGATASLNKNSGCAHSQAEGSV